MHLFITRHGKAHSESKTGRDEDRPLKSRGVRQAEFLVRELSERDERPTVIYSSGLLRADQTADIIAEELGAERVVEPVLGLGHRASDVAEVIDLMRRRHGDPRVMIVGHNPQLESLVAVLSEGPGAEPVRMRTGTCVWMRCDTPRAGETDETLLGHAEIVETIRLAD